MENLLQAVMKVCHKEYLTPHYVRVWLTGEKVTDFAEMTIGEHNKILIPPKGVNQVYFPYWDTEKICWVQPPQEVCSVTRTYTHRGFDAEKKEIWIDFAVHGEDGPASS